MVRRNSTWRQAWLLAGNGLFFPGTEGLAPLRNGGLTAWMVRIEHHRSPDREIPPLRQSWERDSGQRAVTVVVEGLLYFLAGVHHEGAVLDDGLAKGAGCQQQKARAVLTGGDFDTGAR